MKSSTHHASKTFRGAPACAGSGAANPVSDADGWNYTCPVCKRTGFSLTNNTKVLGTHLHADDLASPTATTGGNTHRTVRTIDQITFTPEQHEAIKAFVTDNSVDTYRAMLDTGVEVGHGSNGYVGYAREQGWS